MERDLRRDLIGIFFDRIVRDFDAHYATDKTAGLRLVDGMFRRSMQQRYAWTLDRLRHRVAGRTVLDVGCGSGRYAVALAKAGAARVVGVDVAPRMLDAAVALARAEGVKDRCEFVHGDFLGVPFDRFDYTLAIGFFDYMREPVVYARRLEEVTAGEVIASFPARWHWLTPQRKLRYLGRGIPLRFYTRGGIQALLAAAALAPAAVEDLGRDFVVAAVRA